MIEEVELEGNWVFGTSLEEYQERAASNQIEVCKKSQLVVVNGVCYLTFDQIKEINKIIAE